MTLSIIVVILFWELLCYGFYLNVRDKIRSGTNSNRHGYNQVKLTDKELNEQSVGAGIVTLIMAILPFIYLFQL